MANVNHGAINADQLRLLGLTWPPQSGWMREVIGKELSDDHARLFRLMRGMRGKERRLVFAGRSHEALEQAATRWLARGAKRRAQVRALTAEECRQAARVEMPAAHTGSLNICMDRRRTRGGPWEYTVGDPAECERLLRETGIGDHEARSALDLRADAAQSSGGWRAEKPR
jgi:hypothetical protein